MADDRSSRDKQARDEEQRQRERDLETELERGDDVEPPVDTAALEALETDVDELDFPARGTDIVAAIGDREVTAAGRSYTVAELIPELDGEIFDSPPAVRVQIRRPTVAAAMKRIVEASRTLRNTEFRWTQRKAYEATLESLVALDADDDDVMVETITDWIIERINEDETLPSSRAVRRQAAKTCRANGYEIRVDEWLGI